MSRPRPRLRLLVRLLALVAGLLVLAVLVLLSCVSFERELTPEQESRVRRSTYAAPTGRVALLAAGTEGAPRVILVHGTPGDSSDWLALLLSPPPGCELLAVDRPGFGRSEPRGAVPALHAQAEALLPLLAPRGGHWPVLVGHSLGAPIVALLAAEHPDRVGGLLLLAGALDPALEEWHWYNRVAGALGPLLSRPLRNSNDELRPLRSELASLAGLLPAVRCPVVIVHGRQDQLVPFANAAYAQRMLTGASEVRLVDLPYGDHFLPWNAQDTLRSALASLTGR